MYNFQKKKIITKLFSVGKPILTTKYAENFQENFLEELLRKLPLWMLAL